MEKLKVLIVGSSLFYKNILTQAVEKTGLGQVERTASNGVLALERLKQHNTDVLLLDLFASEPQGIEILESIRKEYPEIFVILFGTGSTKADNLKTALEKGALDLIQKPSVTGAEKSVENIKNQLQGLFTQIMTRKYTAGGSIGPTPGSEPAKLTTCRPKSSVKPPKKKMLSGVDLVVIASSTGGPGALEGFCKYLPADFHKPILVVQHMPAELTKNLARSLSKNCRLPVVEAAEGDPVKPGQVMIAPGGFHMTLQQENDVCLIKLEDTAPVNGVKPAADVLFRSVANVCRGKRVLAVILTGMGTDGLSGVKEMKKTCDCYCLAQSERTCVVYGMPKSVVEAGVSDEVTDLETIPARLLQMVSGRSYSV